MFLRFTTVRVWKIFGWRYRTSSKASVFMNAIMARVTEHYTIINAFDPGIVWVIRIACLVRPDVMSLVTDVN